MLDNNNILSKDEIQKLKKAYNNYAISEIYLNIEVKNIIDCENISKEDAINKILMIINSY